MPPKNPRNPNYPGSGGVPTSELSMVLKGGGSGNTKFYPGQHQQPYSYYNNNESGDQVLFRSDGFDNTQ